MIKNQDVLVNFGKDRIYNPLVTCSTLYLDGERLQYKFSPVRPRDLSKAWSELTICQQGWIQNFEKGGANSFYKSLPLCSVLMEEFSCYRHYHLSVNIANENHFYANVKFKCLPDPSGMFLFDITHNLAKY